MSDVATNSEIEDVLASIRKLVSADEGDKLGGVQQEKAQEPAAAEEEDAADKLVLTPSLRVSEQDAALEAREVPDTPAPSSEDRWEEISLEDRIAELEAAVSRAHDEWEPDGSEMEKPATSFEELVGAGDAVKGEVEAFATDAVAEVVQEELQETEQPPENAAPEKVSPTAFPWQTTQQPEELDDEPAEKVAVDAEQSTTPFELPPEAEIDVSDDPVEELVAPADAQSTQEAPETETFSEPEAVTEAEAAEELAQELEQSPEPEEATVASAMFHHAQPPQLDEKPEEVEPDDTWSAVDESDSVLLDEDSLREMVVAIVREELQGGLGERITRNVRKLVRREINRALASRDFD
ncbi:hypothetical protein ACMU_03390 [Actibacterium mucosum KCTC 23349]|uniref:Uncharacterized protein n=1 Tax=Actibacterium mucosum KCTC 23349 TaxID=1454373 RepID=A0A037ZH39_9RHOB|nr:hypothetical protein [Actibacterium mucosum]KAJ54140.1 hypothetical protein ACMU_03390 [Actibacterium mucosum KCTC 23349]